MNTRKLAVTVVWMAVSGACYGAQEQITVVIFDIAGVPAPVLKFAADTAREAFREVGVDTKWSVCSVSADPSEHCRFHRPGPICRRRFCRPRWNTAWNRARRWATR